MKIVDLEFMWKREGGGGGAHALTTPKSVGPLLNENTHNGIVLSMCAFGWQRVVRLFVIADIFFSVL